MAHHNSNSGCICCNKTVPKAPWDNCLDKDLSGNQLCLKPVILPKNSTLQPHPPQHSTKYRQAQIVKVPGRTVYGRWSRAKWNKDTKKYIILK